MSKKVRTKILISLEQKELSGEINNFHHFKRLLVAKSCVRPKSAPLSWLADDAYFQERNGSLRSSF